jgi:hypothetical protein
LLIIPSNLYKSSSKGLLISMTIIKYLGNWGCFAACVENRKKGKWALRHSSGTEMGKWLGNGKQGYVGTLKLKFVINAGMVCIGIYKYSWDTKL